jgi:hypothetical protein
MGKVAGEMGVGDADPAVPSSPTGRVPQWVLAETVGLPGPPSPWRTPDPPPPPRRRGRGPRVLLVLFLVLLLGAGAAVLVDPASWPGLRAPAPEAQPAPLPVPDAQPSLAPSPEALPPQAPPTERPTPGHEAAHTPLGAPLPPPEGGGAYAFISFQVDGVTPVAYDPCRPVHYVIRPDGAPEGGEELVLDAFARLSAVTGLRFVHDGASDEPGTLEREIFQPQRYGDRWAPVLVAWETEEQNPALAGDTVGEGGSTAVSLGDGVRVYVTGTVSLDAGQLPEILELRNGTETARSIVLHELGHLVGLGHVDDPDQLMYPEARREVPEFAAGDLTGLAVLGNGACVPEL